MRDGTYRYLVQILKDYRRTDGYIKQREEELMHPYRETDENIGGGRSSFISNPSERMAITISEDRRLANLERNRDVIDKCMDQTDVVTKELIRYMYIDYNLNTIRAAQETNISERHARRLHKRFIETIADEIGIVK